MAEVILTITLTDTVATTLTILCSIPSSVCLHHCCRQETVSELLSHMFAGDEVVDSVVTSGLFVLQTLLEYRRLG